MRPTPSQHRAPKRQCHAPGHDRPTLDPRRVVPTQWQLVCYCLLAWPPQAKHAGRCRACHAMPHVAPTPHHTTPLLLQPTMCFASRLAAWAQGVLPSVPAVVDDSPNQVRGHPEARGGSSLFLVLHGAVPGPPARACRWQLCALLLETPHALSPLPGCPTSCGPSGIALSSCSGVHALIPRLNSHARMLWPCATTARAQGLDLSTVPASRHGFHPRPPQHQHQHHPSPPRPAFPAPRRHSSPRPPARTSTPGPTSRTRSAAARRWTLCTPTSRAPTRSAPCRTRSRVSRPPARPPAAAGRCVRAADAGRMCRPVVWGLSSTTVCGAPSPARYERGTGRARP